MMKVETREPREEVSCCGGERGGVLGGLVLLVRRGVGFGIVLFGALFTLSILNQGAGYLEASFRSLLPRKEEQKDPRSYMVSGPHPSSVAVNSSQLMGDN